jgi:hypothetical protein
MLGHHSGVCFVKFGEKTKHLMLLKNSHSSSFSGEKKKED